MVDTLREIFVSSYGGRRKLPEWYKTAGHTECKGASSYFLGLSGCRISLIEKPYNHC
jgi:hypothetical protein